jgi:hypothetical protein
MEIELLRVSSCAADAGCMAAGCSSAGVFCERPSFGEVMVVSCVHVCVARQFVSRVRSETFSRAGAMLAVHDSYLVGRLNAWRYP